MNRGEMEQKIVDTLSKNKEAAGSYISLIQSKVAEKTEQQLKYVLSHTTENIFLEACAGSGKTEVVGLKTAYEISKWYSKNKGIAVLTFTNEATDTIKERVKLFSGLTTLYPHYIGTLTGFIHGFVAQSFGYKYFKHKNRGGDTSYRLIDKNLDVHGNHWLKKYKLPYMNLNSMGPDVYANQIYYNYKINDFVIYYSENYKLPLKEYYQLTEVQEFIQNFRKKNGNNQLLGFDFIKKEIKKVKQTFLTDGFANFEDINNIAYYVLKKNVRIASLIAARFPVIIIDECQDLSWIEINILNQLKDSGSTLHFVGDLNQSIYEFKDANPATTKDYLSGFKRYFLTDNFRSCDSIVNTSNKLLGITLPIRGLAADKMGDKSVCYLEYHDLTSLNQKYLDFLERNDIPFNRSAILVRQQTLKEEFETNSKESIHPILDALQLWIENTPKSRKLALELASKHMQRWFGGAKTRNNYYCPNAIDSVYRWRIFIKDFLEGCSAVSDLVKFDGINYSTWYKNFNNHFLHIIQEAYKDLLRFDSEKRDFKDIPKMISPRGTAKVRITAYNTTDRINLVSIHTIHSVKGKDFDSVMVVSSRRNAGSGHWKQWIEKELESGRIGYVANTRAKYSLVWGVPVLKKEEREMLEYYGFKRAD
ncbi:ATP-dependent helicase [Cohnella lubricantis]|uniref:DNA 3'-5' helicase n=1 Tax=Cohnella lubricantis TaxID=2163172 RepID=A0A841TBE5_9BACL|nr:ATP-dependent helicase [Cohnella lubricantis]MBB6678332.1 ATP-dependent helicase [Cohnella lubricantis]MBP2120620.1 DNA helicase-2/ATP-dependent DNA helicase PcrA [Cohnella lubricantis]